MIYKKSSLWSFKIYEISYNSFAITIKAIPYGVTDSYVDSQSTPILNKLESNDKDFEKGYTYKIVEPFKFYGNLNKNCATLSKFVANFVANLLEIIKNMV